MPVDRRSAFRSYVAPLALAILIALGAIELLQSYYPLFSSSPKDKDRGSQKLPSSSVAADPVPVLSSTVTAAKNESSTSQSPLLPQREKQHRFARCVCPPGVVSPRRLALGCTLLLRGIAVVPRGLTAFDLIVSNRQLAAQVSHVVKNCPVRSSWVDANAEVELPVQFRVVPQYLARTAMRERCTVRNDFRASNNKWRPPTLGKKPHPNSNNNNDTVGIQTQRYRITFVSNTLFDDVMYHGLLNPGAFQTWATREGVYAKISEMEGSVNGTSYERDAIPEHEQLFISPLHARWRRHYTGLEDLYRVALGENVTFASFVDVAVNASELFAAIGDYRKQSLNVGGICSEYVAIGKWHSLEFWKPNLKKEWATASFTNVALHHVTGGFLRLFHHHLVAQSARLWGDVPRQPGKLLLEDRPVMYDKILQRWRGLRKQYRDPLMASVASSFNPQTEDNSPGPNASSTAGAPHWEVVRFDQLTFKEQYHHVRSSEVLMAAEGSFFPWMMWTRPNTTWIIVNEVDERFFFKTSLYHIAVALYLCNIRLLVIDVFHERAAPLHLWEGFLKQPLHGGTTAWVAEVGMNLTAAAAVLGDTTGGTIPPSDGSSTLVISPEQDQHLKKHWYQSWRPNECKAAN